MRSALRAGFPSRWTCCRNGRRRWRKGASLWCRPRGSPREAPVAARQRAGADGACSTAGGGLWLSVFRRTSALRDVFVAALSAFRRRGAGAGGGAHRRCGRSEEHTSELQSLMRISYAVFCLKKKKKIKNTVPVIKLTVIEINQYRHTSMNDTHQMI